MEPGGHLLLRVCYASVSALGVACLLGIAEAGGTLLTTPFLTELDSRAAVKGSRDPLGIQTIWTRFGRHVVGNLTTVTTSVRDFTVLLLGYYFAERLSDSGSQVSTLQAFLKWEQLASYARVAVNRDLAFRGTERVQKRLADGGKVRLSADAAWTILGDQRNYGLWGLYTVPARASGLLDGDPPRLTAAANTFVESFYMPMLADADMRRGDALVALLSEDGPVLHPEGRDRKLLETVAALIKPRLRASEKAFFREHLLLGGPGETTEGRQQRLAELFEAEKADTAVAWTPKYVRALAKEARGRGDEWSELALRLERIVACESVVAPASALFEFLQGCDGLTIEQAATAVSKAWKGGVPVDPGAVRDIKDELGASLTESADRWVALADALATANYAAGIQLVLLQNRAVMQDRGGGAWIEKSGAQLDVRFRDEEHELPSGTELKDLWRFPYFLDNLRMFTRILGEDR